MTASELRQRPRPGTQVPENNLTDGITNPALDPKIGHPSGEAKYGRFRALFRAFTFSLYFGTGIIMYEFRRWILVCERKVI
jgi:hypothetical protein